jgi:hypothetical protein
VQPAARAAAAAANRAASRVTRYLLIFKKFAQRNNELPALPRPGYAELTGNSNGFNSLNYYANQYEEHYKIQNGIIIATISS